MVASPKELAATEKYVAAKDAFREDPTPANKAKMRKLQAEVVAIRNDERGDRPFAVTGEQN